MKKLELLAPGGNVESIKAAIAAGANAVYCGLSTFNARGRATNLSIKELEEVISLGKQFNVKIYLTLNTIIYDNEFDELYSLIIEIEKLGISGVIVQDYGLFYVLKNSFPNLEIHASTQTTTHNTGQIDFLANFNVKQVNLSRELSLKEIESISSKLHSLNIKSEVFVHGAFCISFSGQCYMSGTLTGHSGNRGECVQSCRRSYSTTKKKEELLPFNLKDNNLFANADKLIKAGVDSFKIEGRIKNFQYVYTTIDNWRKQIDSYTNKQTISKSSENLKKVFNREFTSGYLKGELSPNMFIDTSRDQSLISLSKISSYSADKKTLKLQSSVDILDSDTLLIYTADFTFICTGKIGKRINKDEYIFIIEHKLKGKIEKNQILYKLADSDRINIIKKKIDNIITKKEELKVHVSGCIKEKLIVIFSSKSKTVTITSKSILLEASSKPLDKNILQEKLGKLGNSNFSLTELETSKLIGNLFLPIKELNEIKREALLALEEKTINTKYIEPSALLDNNTEKHIPKEIFITSDINLAYKTETKKTLIIELPPSLKKSLNNYKELINNNSNIVPYYPSILIGDDFDTAINLLKETNSKNIITDNTGIAIEAEKLNIKWIAGPLFNLTNSYSFKMLSEFNYCHGAFISTELKKAEILHLNKPNNFDLYYINTDDILLMNSRQCLVRNIIGCSKDKMDENCLSDCNKQANVYDKNKNAFLVTKRPGFYNQIRHNARRNLEIVKGKKEVYSFVVSKFVSN